MYIAETQPTSHNLVINPSTHQMKRKPGRPPKHRLPQRTPEADFKWIRMSDAVCSTISHLKNELGFRSDDDTLLWLLRQTRPWIVANKLDSVRRSVCMKYSQSLFDKSGSSLPVVVGGRELGERQLVRATVVQASTVFFDTPATLDKVERLIANAAAYGSQLTVFPEAFVGGYPQGASTTDSSESNGDFQKYYTSAINVPGPEFDRLAKLAGKYKVHLVIGVVERAGSCLYSTTLIFDSNGMHLGKQRKLMPMAFECAIRNSKEKSSPSMHATSIGRVGCLICWDNRSPLLRTELYDKGVEIYCAPTLDASEAWNASMIHIAAEGSCFVLAANQFYRSKDYPTPSGKRNVDKFLDASTCGGGSVIVSPSGAILAGPNYQGECLISADLDFGEIARAKAEFCEAVVKAGPSYVSWNANGFHSTVFANGMGREEVSEEHRSDCSIE